MGLVVFFVVVVFDIQICHMCFTLAELVMCLNRSDSKQ